MIYNYTNLPSNAFFKILGLKTSDCCTLWVMLSSILSASLRWLSMVWRMACCSLSGGRGIFTFSRISTLNIFLRCCRNTKTCFHINLTFVLYDPATPQKKGFYQVAVCWFRVLVECHVWLIGSNMFLFCTTVVFLMVVCAAGLVALL